MSLPIPFLPDLRDLHPLLPAYRLCRGLQFPDSRLPNRSAVMSFFPLLLFPASSIPLKTLSSTGFRKRCHIRVKPEYCDLQSTQTEDLLQPLD